MFCVVGVELKFVLKVGSGSAGVSDVDVVYNIVNLVFVFELVAFSIFLGRAVKVFSGCVVH